MKCGDLMTTNLEWLTEADTVLTAAGRMAEAGVGFLPVCGAKGQVVGVVTDRDLTVRALARSVSPNSSVATVMSAPAVTCLASEDVSDAEDLMASEQKSRLVVVDEGGTPLGILSFADLIEKAPSRQLMHTLKAVFWRESLGPRGGAAPGEPLLKDDPAARAPDPEGESIHVRDTVFTGGHRAVPPNKMFP